ncbi:MAG: MlaD family protein [Alphaproteobacteria bacterium]
MLKNINDSMLGFLAICAIAVVGYFATMDTPTHKHNKYNATFENIDGVNIGTNVYMHGVKIGNVETMKLVDGMAKVSISVLKSVKIPVDSTLMVETPDFFSNKTLAISPGFEEDYLKNNQGFASVQNSVNFLGLLNDYLDGKMAEKGK